MKVYVVRKDSYDIDSDYTDIVAVYSTKEKAEEFKRLKEQEEIEYQELCSKCDECTLLRETLNYLDLCDIKKLPVDKQAIKQRFAQYKEEFGYKRCEVEFQELDNGEIFDIRCVGRERLFYPRDTTYYKIIPMELQ